MANPFTSEAEDGFLENLREADYAELAQNLWEAARDEWLGLDDFRRSFSKLRKGDFFGALKSAATGALELGGTVAMFTPAAPGAAALKGATTGAKAGKAAKQAGTIRKLYNVLKPLSLEEQVAGRTASRLGVKRGATQMANLKDLDPTLVARAREDVLENMFNIAKGSSAGGQMPLFPEVVQAANASGRARQAARTLLPTEVGYGRGGMLGSAARGITQLTGTMPTSQGMLANRAFRARQLGKTPSLGARAGEFASGKVGAAGTRTGFDPIGNALAMRQGPEMTPYGITKAQFDQYSQMLTPQEMALFIQLLQEAQQSQGAM